MNSNNNFNKSISCATDDKEFAVDKVTCTVTCGYLNNNGMYINNIFLMEGNIANGPSSNYSKSRAKIFDEILKNLEMTEEHGTVIIESKRELLAKRSDGYYVFLYF